jgi:hydroxypyruvate isomerase
MPRLSANLGFLFNEVPFLDRFGAAARAGFRAVEFAFAYDVPPPEIAARLAEHALECVLINAPPGDLDAGERGIASLPGREGEFAASITEALRYAHALGCPRIHVLSGIVPPRSADGTWNVPLVCGVTEELVTVLGGLDAGCSPSCTSCTIRFSVQGRLQQ